MTDPIEAMARKIALANNDYDGPELHWEGYVDDAQAALQALRDTLVPVGWMYTKDGAESAFDWEPMTSTFGWTETPLYALPEIKP